MANKSLGIEFQATDNVSATVNQINRELDSLGDKEKDLQKISERFDKITNSTMPVKRQLRELQQIMANMNLKGLTNTDVFTEVASKAGELKDAMSDAAEAVRNYSSDTMELQAAAQAFQGIAAAGSIATGVIGLLGDESKDLQKILVKVQAAQAVLNGVMAIANILNKDSVLMLKLKQIRMVALTASTVGETTAETANTVATGANTVAKTAATVAQNALNVSIAVGKALFGDFTGLAIVAAAGLVAFGVASATASDEQEDLNGSVERGKNIQNAYYDEYNSNLSKTMGNYSRLQSAWNNLKSESEKNQWIKDNKDAFHELGFEITSTQDAENFFVQNEAKVIASFTARAEAAALAAQQVEIFNQALKDMPQVGESKSAQWFSENGLQTKGRRDTNKGFMRFEYQYEFTEEDRKKLIDSRLSAAREASDKLAKLQLDAEKRANSTAAETGAKVYNKKREKELKKGGTHTTKVEIKTDDNSLTKAEDNLKKLEEIRSKMSIDSPDLPKVKAQIEALKKDIEQKKIKLGIEAPKTNVDLLSDFEKKLEQAVKNAEGDYMMAFLNGESEKLDELYTKWENAIRKKQEYTQVKNMQDPSKGVEVKGQAELKIAVSGNFDKTIEGYKTAISTLQKEIESIDWKNLSPGDPNLGTFEKYSTAIAKYREELEKLETEFDNSIMTPAEKSQAKMERLSKEMDTAGSVASSVSSAFGALGNAFSQAGDDSTAAAMQVIGSVADMVAQIIPQIIALIGAKEGEALAAGTAGAAAMPYPASIAAIASIVSTIIGTFATIASIVGSFAEGGIIQGNNYSGDHLLARVNAGEMIINNKDQKRLWDFIHGKNNLQGDNAITVGNVRIKGSDLYVALKNYTKVNDKKI